MPTLVGKVALITGGASGIGRAIAERFVAEGARVAIGDINETAGQTLAASLGDAALFVKLDITQQPDWTAAIAAVTAPFGKLTCLINNAAVSLAGSIVSTSEAAWQQTMAVNATGTFLGCQAAVMTMRESGGVILNIASVRGQRPSSGQAAYCASKALILSLTESTALYCGENSLPIRCNAICPGVIDTPILGETRQLLGGGEKAEAALRALQPIGRLGLPAEIAAMAAFLASDDASFITGAALNVDGGMRIRNK